MSVSDFMIGADPEFSCFRQGHIVSARDYCDDSGEFGADGNGVTFEIRPKPSKNPIEVVTNITNIFRVATASQPELKTFKWVAGSSTGGYPMGGHVHFGVKNLTSDYRYLVNKLDNYFGMIMVLVEDITEGKQRRQSGYGRVGECRTQEHGIEYRALSSWLTSPYIAAATLCLGKIVAYESLIDSQIKWKDQIAANDFTSMNVAKLRGLFPEVWKDITQMKLYQQYKPYVDILYFLITNKLTWFPKCGMKEMWGIFNVKADSSRVPLNFIWSRYMQTNSATQTTEATNA